MNAEAVSVVLEDLRLTQPGLYWPEPVEELDKDQNPKPWIQLVWAEDHIEVKTRLWSPPHDEGVFSIPSVRVEFEPVDTLKNRIREATEKVERTRAEKFEERMDRVRSDDFCLTDSS